MGYVPPARYHGKGSPWQRPPWTEIPLWTEWHTGVKTLHSLNFVAGGNEYTEYTISRPECRNYVRICDLWCYYMVRKMIVAENKYKQGNIILHQKSMVCPTSFMVVISFFSSSTGRCFLFVTMRCWKTTSPKVVNTKLVQRQSHTSRNFKYDTWNINTCNHFEQV